MSEKLPFYHSLRFKLSCLFICFVAVPIILFLVIFIKEVQDSSGEKYRSMLNSSLSQTAQNVSADLDMVIRSAKIFVNDPEIANTLQMDSSDKYNIYQKKLQLKERLENIKTQYSFVTDLWSMRRRVVSPSPRSLATSLSPSSSLMAAQWAGMPRS